jgi:hypothetical protein
VDFLLFGQAFEFFDVFTRELSIHHPSIAKTKLRSLLSRLCLPFLFAYSPSRNPAFSNR